MSPFRQCGSYVVVVNDGVDDDDVDDDGDVDDDDDGDVDDDDGGISEWGECFDWDLTSPTCMS